MAVLFRQTGATHRLNLAVGRERPSLGADRGSDDMPLHAQVLCIGGNALFAFFFLVAAQQTMVEGNYGLAAFLAFLGAAAIYSCWVLLKFRRYLSAEETTERELHIEQLRAEIDQLKAGEKTGG